MLCTGWVVADLQVGHGFFLGLIEGLQQNPDKPSSCLKQYSETITTLELVRLPVGINDIGNSLIRIRDFLNEATLLDQTCGFRDLTSQILSVSQAGGAEEIAVSIVANVTFFKQLWSNLVIAFNNGISYDIGWNLAKIISRLFNYYI